MSKTAAKKATEEKFVGMAWETDEFIHQFLKRGQMVRSIVSGVQKGNSDEYEWEVIDGNKVDAKNKNGEVMHFTLKSDNSGLVKFIHSSGRVLLDDTFTLMPITKK